MKLSEKLIGYGGSQVVPEDLSAEAARLEARVAELQCQRDEALSMLGAIISSTGGLYHIPDHMLQVGYEFKSERGDNETIVCARKV